MSNVYDLAHALAKGLRESEEYQNFQLKQEQLLADESAKTMYDNFRQEQMELQMKQMNGTNISTEEIEKMNKLFEVIQLNPLVMGLLESEQKLSTVFDDINNILYQPLKEVFEGDSSI